MNTDPKISVVIGAYNEEQQIARTLQSLIGQTVDDFEIIVVDDGSTDSTTEVVTDFSDERIRLISTEQNRGLPAALNQGIKNAQGKYIARADADEVSLPYRLQQQSQVLEEHSGVQAVGCWYINVGRNGKRIVDVEISQDRSFDTTDLLKNGPGVAHGSMMLRSDALASVGRYRETFQLAQDYDLWLRMAEEFGVGWLYVVPEVLYERKIDVSQLQKRHKQRIFAEAARECAQIRQRGGNESKLLNSLSERVRDTDNPGYTKRELEGMYQYLVGTQLLEQNEKSAARQHLLKSLRFAPVRPRPWYRLGLSLLQPEQRQTVQDWAKQLRL